MDWAILQDMLRPENPFDRFDWPGGVIPSVMSRFMPLVGLAIVPPLILLALGSAVRWALGGFRM